MPPRRKHPPQGPIVCCPYCCSTHTFVRWKDPRPDFLLRIVRHRTCRDCDQDFETRQGQETVTRKVRQLAS